MDENIGTILARVSRLLRRRFDERARAIGVTRPQWNVLSVLKCNEGINQGCLAEMLEVEPITACRMIDRLQDAGLVERRQDPADRRAWRLHVTEKGDTLFDQLRPCAHETFDEALEGIDPEEREVLMTILLRMLANLSRKTPAEMAANG